MPGSVTPPGGHSKARVAAFDLPLMSSIKRHSMKPLRNGLVAVAAPERARVRRSGGTVVTVADLRSQMLHRWYTRPVLFVADVNRALRFYVGTLGFEKRWHEGNGAGGVCQVNRDECEIILCEDPARRDRGRLFVELTPEAVADLRRELAQGAVAAEETWWGNDAIQVKDPDGNELLFPIPD